MSKTETHFSRQISKTTKIIIFPVVTGITASSAIYAVNWFNLKHRWLYNFYNKLAAPLVLKVGGKVHFKGFQTRKIHGNEEDGRDALLIVNYIGPLPFLDMISKRYFQLISILRITAVKQFDFAFTKREDHGTEVGGSLSGKHYLVHHYRNSKNFSLDLALLNPTLSKLEINLYYAGKKAASVVREDRKSVRLEAPFGMHGILVLESDNHGVFEQLIKMEAYASLLEKLDNNYLALFERVV